MRIENYRFMWHKRGSLATQRLIMRKECNALSMNDVTGGTVERVKGDPHTQETFGAYPNLSRACQELTQHLSVVCGTSPGLVGAPPETHGGIIKTDCRDRTDLS